MLKRRSAERSDWQRVLERRFASATIDDARFTGVVTLLCIDAVSEPLWIKTAIQDFCIADAGHSWLQHFPTGKNYAVTTMFDTHGEVIQWYIDIVKQHGTDARGIPWWDDLYLDIIINPDGSTLILDEDELDEALQSGLVNHAEHQLAWDVTNQLCDLIQQNHFPLLELSPVHRQRLLANLE